MSQAIELHTLFTFRCFCLVQKKKGVAGAVIEADTMPLDALVYPIDYPSLVDLYV